MKSAKTPRLLLDDRKVSEAVARLDVRYVESAKLQSQLATAGMHPMAIVSFGEPPSPAFSCPIVTLDLSQIGGPPLAEVWSCDRPVQTMRSGNWSMAMNGDVLVGSINLEEKPGLSLDSATYLGYREMFHQLRDLGYPYLWRAWNYFPRINDEQEGLERYRRFCVGRYQALTETLADFPTSLPAATAIGTRSGPLQIVFLAGTQPATHLSNPRQLNAYEYPQDYGPRSPSFARATFTRSESESLLFIAGTASVVGHASRHVGLPIEQTRETIENLCAVLRHTESVTGITFAGAQHRPLYKVYVRDPDSMPGIRRALHELPLSHDHILFLHGNLCRSELLVEIEGLIISDQ